MEAQVSPEQLIDDKQLLLKTFYEFACSKQPSFRNGRTDIVESEPFERIQDGGVHETHFAAQRIRDEQGKPLHIQYDIHVYRIYPVGDMSQALPQVLKERAKKDKEFRKTLRNEKPEMVLAEHLTVTPDAMQHLTAYAFMLNNEPIEFKNAPEETVDKPEEIRKKFNEIIAELQEMQWRSNITNILGGLPLRDSRDKK